MTRVLSVASEIYPLVKTGGLADVAGALPGALAPHGVEMRTLVPGYPAVIAALEDVKPVSNFRDLFGGPAKLLSASAAGLSLFVIDAPHLYQRDGGIYVDAAGIDWPDNWKRFAALSFVAAAIGRGSVKEFKPKVLHAHDWQAGLVPAYVAFGARRTARTVLTVHNLAFQGQFGAEIFGYLHLPPEAYSVDAVEYYGGVGFLKAGLQMADAVTTVSPTYAAEIRTSEFGMGLDGLLNARGAYVSGILNGIDIDAWDPGTDIALAEPFRSSNVKKRALNKYALQARFGLEQQADAPLFGVVSRLTWQKGMDLLSESIDALVDAGGQLCVLGSGEPALEHAIEAAPARHPGHIGMVRGYDEKLAHLVQGGADALLVPSRFEPCGLTQLIALRYGAVPVVARTGGLADTVIDANPVALAAGVATGVVFSPVTATALRHALQRTVDLYRRPKVWAQMQRKGMKTDVSWDVSAGEYAKLYNSLLGKPETDDDQDG